MIRNTTLSLIRRRGVTSVLAMLYLVLFATLAIGFYAATNTQSQVTSNDQRVARAHAAAESGMDFMRYQLGRVSVPPNTPTDQVINELYTDLQAQLDGTGNLGAQTISKSGNIIHIPDGDGTINLDPSGESRFRATLTDWAGEVVVKIEGKHGSLSMTRAITMDFSRATKPTSAFNYAIASKGQIIKNKNGSITSVPGVDPQIATMMSAMSADPAILMSAGTIGGDLSHTETGTVQVTGGTVGGSSIPSVILSDHVHEVEEPEFPTVDPTVYRPYAVNAWVDKAKTQSNIYIPANTNPKFNANDTVQGIMYIESPNTVTFNGNFNLQGFIVMAAGTSTTDELIVSGNLTMSPLPSGSQFDALRATTGVAILAPKAAVSMTGSSGGNVKGNIMCNTFTWQGASELQVDQGTIMTFGTGPNTCLFDSAKSIKFSSTGSSNVPVAGVTYSTYFKPNPVSYQEVTP